MLAKKCIGLNPEFKPAVRAGAEPRSKITVAEMRGLRGSMYFDIRRSSPFYLLCTSAAKRALFTVRAAFIHSSPRA
jgi:hypothetical protein